jgi:hypothetical protein
MEVFSKGVVVTATLLPLWKKKGWNAVREAAQVSSTLHPVCTLPCTHLKDQLHDLWMHHAMHRLPVHVGDQVSRTQPRLLGWATFLHVLGTENPTEVGLTGLVIRKAGHPGSVCTTLLITACEIVIILPFYRQRN